MKKTDEKLPLEFLDPGSGDPGFWIRFHSRVLAEARDELSRRRMAGELSVVDVVFSWRRTLVPLALMAAALAGLLMTNSSPEEPVQMVAVDEFLREDFNLLPAAGVLSGDGSYRNSALLMVEGGF